MTRAPFNVHVLPFRHTEAGWRYALLRRSDLAVWQGVAGGGEGAETVEEAARREAFEEAGIPLKARLVALDSMTTVPVSYFPESAAWGEDTWVIPSYGWGIECVSPELVLSPEHTATCWLDYDSAMARLHFDSNRHDLWELDRRLRGVGPRD